MDWALNNPQWLIWSKTQTNKQTNNKDRLSDNLKEKNKEVSFKIQSLNADLYP